MVEVGNKKVSKLTFEEIESALLESSELRHAVARVVDGDALKARAGTTRSAISVQYVDVRIPKTEPDRVRAFLEDAVHDRIGQLSGAQLSKVKGIHVLLMC